MVWKFYDNQHAYAAKLVKTTINGLTTQYEEDMVEVDTRTWSGLRLGDLKQITDRAQLPFAVLYFVCKTVQQTVSEEKMLMPEFVTQPQGASEVGGNMLEPKTGKRSAPWLTSKTMPVMIMAVAGMAAVRFNHEHLDSSRELAENPSLDQQWLELIHEEQMEALLHGGGNDDSTGSDSDGEELPRSAMAVARGSAQATKQFSVNFANPTVNSFLEPELTDRSLVEPASVQLGYKHDAFTRVMWGNRSDTILWTDDMEEQQTKFKRQPKTKDKSSVMESKENFRVHVECQHGFALISGERLSEMTLCSLFVTTPNALRVARVG